MLDYIFTCNRDTFISDFNCRDVTNLQELNQMQTKRIIEDLVTYIGNLQSCH